MLVWSLMFYVMGLVPPLIASSLGIEWPWRLPGGLVMLSCIVHVLWRSALRVEQILNMLHHSALSQSRERLGSFVRSRVATSRIS